MDGVVKDITKMKMVVFLWSGMSKYLTRYSFFRLQARVAGIQKMIGLK